MSRSNEEMVKAFAQGKEGRSGGGNVFALGGVLYSYGEHFPLAIRMPAETNRKAKGEPWYLLNGDKYSVTTSAHQSYTFQAFKDSPRVSLTACRAAGLEPMRGWGKGVNVELVDFWADTWAHRPYTWEPEGTREEEPERWAEYDKAVEETKAFEAAGVPHGATPSYDKEGVLQSWHRIGAVVLSNGVNHFLCAMDEGSYFVSKLPRKVKTVAEAFASLEPRQVSEEKARGVEVIRQGEWYFIPEPQVVIPAKEWKRGGFDLPRQDERANVHRATWGVVETLGGRKGTARIYVRGRVRHVMVWKDLSGKERATATGEHRVVNLAKGVPYWAVKNRSLGDWSGGGKVD